MQTFLPYADFEESAYCLDYKRVGKQRVEAKQIFNCLEYRRKNDWYMRNKNGKIQLRGWINHVAVKLWEGYDEALKLYINTFINEWECRGYNNNMAYYTIDYNKLVMPPWLGNEKLHASHRSNLLKKDNVFYSQYDWTEPDNIEYVWFDCSIYKTPNSPS